MSFNIVFCYTVSPFWLPPCVCLFVFVPPPHTHTLQLPQKPLTLRANADRVHEVYKQSVMSPIQTSNPSTPKPSATKRATAYRTQRQPQVIPRVQTWFTSCCITLYSCLNNVQLVKTNLMIRWKSEVERKKTHHIERECQGKWWAAWRRQEVPFMEQFLDVEPYHPSHVALTT